MLEFLSALIQLGLPILLAGAQQPPPTNGGNVVAVVNGAAITTSQLDSALGSQAAALRRQMQSLRRSMLLKMIDNVLIEQAARTAGVSVDQYLRTNVESVRISDEEVEREYSRIKDQFPGALPSEAKYRIRRNLEDSRRGDALRRLTADLRRNATIINHLAEDAVKEIRLDAAAGAVRGKSDAPVTVVEFLDYECPFCRAAENAVADVMRRWPNEVRLALKHLPLDKHRYAFDAATAAICADRQGGLWLLHGRMLAKGGDLSPERLSALASEVGLDTRQFELCMRSPDAAERVRQDIALARSVGVEGTPAFFVNNRRIANAQTLPAAVQEELARLGRAPAASGAR